MNDRSTKPHKPESKAGFYAVLYSLIGVMLMVAIVLGYNSFNNSKMAEEKPPIVEGDYGKAPTQQEDSSAVGKSGDQSVADAQWEYDQEIASGNAGKTGAKTPVVTPVPNTAVTQKPAPVPATPPPTQAPPASDSGTSSADDEIDALEAGHVDGESDEGYAEAEERTFTAFDPEQRMTWPVVGEIVMPYSSDKLVYDSTLEQFRTNESVSIEAPAGTEVLAAASGVVTDVYTTRENGNTIVINHGNGWCTTYSQLTDDILVSLDDVVFEGDVLGYVGEPSIYSVMLGSHLDFSVIYHDEAVNPNEYLVASN